MTMSMKAVLVTTEHKGVFFGYLPEEEVTQKETMTLHNARNCVYWTSDAKGFLGLAVTGPLKGSRIGPAVPKLTLFDITSVAQCSPEAVENWEKGIWQ